MLVVTQLLCPKAINLSKHISQPLSTFGRMSHRRPNRPNNYDDRRDRRDRDDRREREDRRDRDSRDSRNFSVSNQDYQDRPVSQVISRNFNQPGPQRVCWKCFKPGHISPNCPLKLNSPGDKFLDFERLNPGLLDDFMRRTEEEKKAAARSKELETITEAVSRANQSIFEALGAKFPGKIQATKRPAPDIAENDDNDTPPRKKRKSGESSSKQTSPGTMLRSLEKKIDNLQRTTTPSPLLNQSSPTLNLTSEFDDQRRSLSNEIRSEIQSALRTPSPLLPFRHVGNSAATKNNNEPGQFDAGVHSAISHYPVSAPMYFRNNFDQFPRSAQDNVFPRSLQPGDRTQTQDRFFQYEQNLIARSEEAMRFRAREIELEEKLRLAQEENKTFASNEALRGNHANQHRNGASVNESEATNLFRAREAELEEKLRLAEEDIQRRAAKEAYLEKHAVDLRSQFSINEDEKNKFLRAREAELESKLRIAEEENKRRAANEIFLQRQANEIRSQLSVHEDVELRSLQARFAADQELEAQLMQRRSPIPVEAQLRSQLFRAQQGAAQRPVHDGNSTNQQELEAQLVQRRSPIPMEAQLRSQLLRAQQGAAQRPVHDGNSTHQNEDSVQPPHGILRNANDENGTRHQCNVNWQVPPAIDIEDTTPLEQRVRRRHNNIPVRQVYPVEDGEILEQSQEHIMMNNSPSPVIPVDSDPDDDAPQDVALREAVNTATRIARARVIYIAGLKDNSNSGRKKWNRELIKSECAEQGITYNAKHIQKTVEKLAAAIHQ